MKVRAIGLLLIFMAGPLVHAFSETVLISRPSKDNTIVLGMAMLEKVPVIDFKKIASELKSHYKVNIDKESIDEEKKGTGVFAVGKFRILIALMDLPIPDGELDVPIEASYLWPEAAKETAKHKAHIIISVTSNEKDIVNAYRLFTKAAAAILKTTNALGIYLGNQQMVLPTSLYVEMAETMTDDTLPLVNWVYIGVWDEDNKRGGFTFGLEEFGFNEVEIIDSKHSREEIWDFLYNVAHYIIFSDVTLNDGETVGLTANEKLKVVVSDGVHLPGRTVKIKY